MTDGHLTYYAQWEKAIPPIVSLMRVPNDLLFHEVGSDTVRIASQLNNVMTTIKGWFNAETGHTDDIVVRDTTMGNQNWRLELKLDRELTALTNSALVLGDALAYRNGGTIETFGLGDTITVITHQDVQGGYGTLNWGESTGIFVNEDTSAYLNNLAAVKYQSEFT